MIEEAIMNGISYQPVIPEANIVQIGSKMIKSGIQTSSDSALMKEIWDKKAIAKQFVEQFGFTVLSDYVVGNRRKFDEIFPRVKGMAVSVKNSEGPQMKKQRCSDWHRLKKSCGMRFLVLFAPGKKQWLNW